LHSEPVEAITIKPQKEDRPVRRFFLFLEF
jgi:hypothetical protein